MHTHTEYMKNRLSGIAKNRTEKIGDTSLEGHSSHIGDLTGLMAVDMEKNKYIQKIFKVN